ncbi:peptide ligase PGM1-related protein [Oscillatoria sp. FACHB-1406]|uniref:peptide ligase PGM1-related protein n=1 Tax=Oscillatoria sp. FACHB-1406 TaxID=2692846 RepID=UPI0016827C0C|nr:peptide ligase PGM1-related protein [Oscillatoria sp. FACHB-1406]MBD2579445.1 carboxylate-amine ligase [Oscillatoria sp. FACHB-1406]
MQTIENRPAEPNVRFRQLQDRLRDSTASDDRLDLDDRDILVIPSLSLDREQLRKVSGFIHYEERLLFSLIRLRNPHTRLIYVTALPLSPLIIDYYLQLLPGIPFSHARDRLLLFSTYDASVKPLTQKILERPRLVERLRKALRPGKSHMVCFNASPLEQELSLALDIPLLAACPDLLYWGSKSGSRELFAEVEIPHPVGSLSVWTVDELVKEAVALRSRQPDLRRMAIKLNEGFSGEGNAVLDLKDLSADASLEAIETAVRANLQHLSLQAADETWESFSRRIPELGAIVEAFVEGEEKRSPSVQGYISPDGRVKILSTHDQILGGPDGQIYLGCRFPADNAYRLRLQDMGLEIGKALAAKGAMERYGVDFIAVRSPEKDGQWDLQAIEINLRKGGTTHPFMALKLLTNGNYDAANGLLYSQQGQAKYYIATDNLQKPQYRGLLPSDLMDIITCHHLHFDSSTMTGTVFHLIGALSEFGKLGLTSIGNTIEEAVSLYQRAESVLDAETQTGIDPSESSSSPTLPITWLGSE